MSETTESTLIREFLEAMARDELPGDARLVFQTTGGMPSTRRDEKFEVLGDGRVKFTTCSMSPGATAKEGTAKLPPSEHRQLLRLFSRGLDSLLPRSRARFLPDSAIGSITIQLGEKTATLYFLEDEDDRAIQGKPIASEILQAIQQIRMIPERSMREGQEDERYQS